MSHASIYHEHLALGLGAGADSRGLSWDVSKIDTVNLMVVGSSLTGGSFNKK